MKKYILAGGMVCLLLLGAGCTDSSTSDVPSQLNVDADTKDTGPIKVGWLGPLTGDVASVGKDAQKAVELAIEEVNADGGIHGRNLQLVSEDGQCTGKEASTAGNKLINVDNVPVIFGGLCSGETLAVAPLAEQFHRVLISSCSSAPTVTTAGDYVFRSYPSDVYQGKFIAEYVYSKLGKKKVAILAVLGNWGAGIKSVFTERFKELGGEVVLVEDYVQDARDLKAPLSKIKAAHPGLILFLGYTAEASVAGLKQAKELGIKVPFFGGDTWDDAKIHESGYAEGIMYAVPNMEAEDASWKDKMKAKGAHATVCSPRAYDDVKIVADIMRRVGTDPEKIKQELYKVKDYPGVAGPVSFDQNGDLVGGQYDVKIVKDKKSAKAKQQSF